MKKILFLNISLVILTAGFPVITSAAVFVYDSIALKSEETMIAAETKGRFFAKGGQIVEFFVEGKLIGRALSGGDGFAYKPYVPRKLGMHEIVARYGNDEDRGIVLSLKKGSRIVFIDLEGSLLANPYTKETIETCNVAIKEIIKKYPVVYLQTGLIGMKIIKKWLKKNKFPESVILTWQMGAIFHDLNNKGIKIKAIIGSQKVVESASDYEPKAFSFDDFDAAERVNDWEEIKKALR